MIYFNLLWMWPAINTILLALLIFQMVYYKKIKMEYKKTLNTYLFPLIILSSYKAYISGSVILAILLLLNAYYFSKIYYIKKLMASPETTIVTPNVKEIVPSKKKLDEKTISLRDNAIKMSSYYKNNIAQYDKEDAIEVVVVSYNKSNKVYYYNANGFKLDTGDIVKVNSLDFVQSAYVVLGNQKIDPKVLKHELKNVVEIVLKNEDEMEVKKEENVVVKAISSEDSVTKVLLGTNEEKTNDLDDVKNE